jgi:hypothetical protein
MTSPYGTLQEFGNNGNWGTSQKFLRIRLINYSHHCKVFPLITWMIQSPEHGELKDTHLVKVMNLS